MSSQFRAPTPESDFEPDFDVELDIDPLHPVVMLCEDDVSLRQSIAAALKEDGYTVIDMHDPVEMRDYLDGSRLYATICNPPDLIITDAWLPGLSCNDLLAVLASNGWNVPVLVLLEHGSPSLPDGPAANAPQMVLRKPIDSSVLCQTVHELIGASDPMNH